MSAHEHAPVDHEDVQDSKYPEADVDHLRPIFMALGFIGTFAALIALFNHDMQEETIVQESTIFAEPIEIEIVPQTVQAPNIPPPPAPQAALMIGYEVTEVDDDQVVGEVELFMLDEDLDAEISDLIYSVDGVRGGTLTEYTPPEVEEDPEPLEREVFVVVEEMPSFPGGEDSMYLWLAKNIKYPIPAFESGVQGKVYVQFIVTNTGEIDDVSMLRGIGGGCDEEAMRVVSQFPRWIPGRQRGRAVNVKFTLPIFFIINNK